MDIARIEAILVDSLGEVDGDQKPLEGCELFNFFVIAYVLRAAKAKEHAAEMIELLKDWPIESWGRPVPPLGEEINYITAGAVLGNQRQAFMLFAFGKSLNWWKILDPHTVLGIKYDDPLGRQIARAGFVAIRGYQPHAAVRA